VTISALLPDPLAGIEIDRFLLTAGATMKGVPHSAGTREYLFCERGAIELVASGASYALGEGDVVVFRGDQKHSYRNLADGDSVAFSVVLLPPPGG
jgi:quercetin dioxygenase-like cupin family protein